MNFEVNKYIDDHVGDMVADLGRLVRIPSVSAEAEPDAPFGSNCAKALEVMLSIAQSAGFTVSNFNNIMGEIDLYPGEEPELAALCHLDVVPAGTGWDSNPFSLTLKDGKAYGRGTADDSYAMGGDDYRSGFAQRHPRPLPRQTAGETGKH